jgi:hypothetical protein
MTYKHEAGVHMASESLQQTETSSPRISEVLRKRLEDIRKLTALRKGESVSTSEIAKQLLESAREDRFEVVELLGKPAEALLDFFQRATSATGLKPLLRRGIKFLVNAQITSGRYAGGMPGAALETGSPRNARSGSRCHGTSAKRHQPGRRNVSPGTFPIGEYRPK